jgi:AraC-like DNA-binding protein
MESARPIGGIDPLSDVLKAVRLTGAIFFLTDAGAPWTVSLPDAGSFLDIVLPPPQHLISYHVITRGSCWCVMPGEPSLKLESGDVLVIPHGDPYALSTDPAIHGQMTDGDAIEFLRQLARRQIPFLVREGSDDPERLHVLCGFLGCDVMPFNPVLASLPRRLHVRHPAKTDRLDHLIDFAMSESAGKEAGSDCVLLRISELMFVEVVRRHLAALPDQRGWLSALRDPVVGRALLLLHNDPARAWTLETLARETGVSRTLLAERFTSLTGQPPMQYLKQWRMQIAAGLLAGGDAKVASIALQVGYDSEAAFSRAFKKEVGISPSLWRSQRA